MTTYADPTRCPDCHAVLPHEPQVCRICSLPLTGSTAVSLFTTLREADRLLGVLREQKRPVAVPAMAGSAASGARLEGVDSYPAAARSQRVGAPRVSGISVPRILLSLGALCLLVAAITFLAFAWSWLGVGGRTVVLVALTGASLGSSVILLGRGLRMAAEALSVVGLGLLVLDVVGARHAGWIGQATGARTTMLAGVVVATTALLLLLVTSSRPLLAPAIAAPLATFVAGVASVSDVDSKLRIVITCAALLALGRVGTELRVRTMVAVSLVAGAITWAALVGDGFTSAIDDSLTMAHFWGAAGAWPLMAAILLMAAAGPVVGLSRVPSSICYGLAGVLGSYVASAPALDNGSTAAATALVTLVAFWSAALAVAPRRPLELAIPLVGTVVFPAVCTVELFISSASALLTVGGPFTRPVGVHVAEVYVDPSRWLLTPLLVVLALAVCAAVRSLTTPTRRTCVLIVVSAVVVGVITSLPLYDVPLALPLGLALGLAVLGLLAAERVAGGAADLVRVGAAVLLVGAALLALPSDVLTTIALAVATLAAALLMLRTDATGATARVALPFAFAGLVWAAANVAGIDAQYRAVPVLLVLGGLAIWRPQAELEVAAGLTAAVVSAAAIAASRDESVALAVHLTIVGALITASSIIHPQRRELGWLGGFLLAAATWVRLADLGVQTPEAYTLPSALALVALGAWRLRQDDRSATLTFLAPGLALATVPSLVAMLDDPYSLRALLLGAACLVLVVLGAGMRWSAPLLVGASVGALLVLRELAPYAAQAPTWLSIGLSGAVLLAVGITWESRMNDVRRASQYVTALR